MSPKSVDPGEFSTVEVQFILQMCIDSISNSNFYETITSAKRRLSTTLWQFDSSTVKSKLPESRSHPYSITEVFH